MSCKINFIFLLENFLLEVWMKPNAIPMIVTFFPPSIVPILKFQWNLSWNFIEISLKFHWNFKINFTEILEQKHWNFSRICFLTWQISFVFSKDFKLEISKPLKLKFQLEISAWIFSLKFQHNAIFPIIISKAWWFPGNWNFAWTLSLIKIGKESFY